MQVFLPYPSFRKSAEALDNKRLNKQIIECFQIFKALRGESKGWQNHPAVLMFKGYERALVSYAIWCCWVWNERGFKEHKLKQEFEEMMRICTKELALFEYPWWYGLNTFHESHRSNLYRKDSQYYSNLKLGFQQGLPYCWPIKVDNKLVLRYKHAGDKKYLDDIIYKEFKSLKNLKSHELDIKF